MNFEKLSDISFKSLLGGLSESKHRELIEFLTPKEKENLKKAPQVQLQDLLDNSIHAFIDHIHPSWIEFILSKYSIQDKRLLIQAFEQQKEKVCEKLNLTEVGLQLSSVAVQFIRNLVYQDLLSLKDQVLPVYTLKKENFYSLLELNQNTIHDIIIGMGFFDLKEELKNLIDKDKIKQLKEAFEEKHFDFLKSINQKPKDLVFTPIGIQNWDGNQTELRELLKSRGLNRLAKIISTSSVSFYWHLSLIFSIDDAKILKKLMVKTIDPKISLALIHQLEESITFFTQYHGV